MKTPPSLSAEFKRLRKAKGLTYRAIGLLCDLDETTVHKVASDRPVRWETLHLILAVGMGVYPGTPDYEAIRRLWMKQREMIAEALAPESGRKTAPSHERKAVAKFRSIIHGRDENETRLILYAAQRRAGKF